MSVKEENEITVKLNCSLEEFSELMEEKGYEVTEKFNLDDRYYIPKELDINKMTSREILSKAVLIRFIEEFNPPLIKKKITFKIKDIDENGDIRHQEAISCSVDSIEDAEKVFLAIGYKKLMRLIEHDTVYKKGLLELAVKDIENGDNLIEIETKDESGFRTVEELKETIDKENIPIVENEYFIKKAEEALNRLLEQ